MSSKIKKKTNKFLWVATNDITRNATDFNTMCDISIITEINVCIITDNITYDATYDAIERALEDVK